MSLGTMSVGTVIKLSLFVWCVAETLGFVLVAKLIGFPEALLLGFLTSVLGWTLLKRAGASAITKLRAVLDGRRVVDNNSRTVLDDTLASVGALALLLPGFLSDVLGLALAVPAARDRLARWMEGGRLARILKRTGHGRERGPTTIDLEPGDWQRNGPSQGPLSKY